MTETPPLPAQGSWLASIPGLAGKARDLYAIHGVNYLDDGAVQQLIAEYLRDKNRMGWRDEAGILLIFGGAVSVWSLLDRPVPPGPDTWALVGLSLAAVLAGVYLLVRHIVLSRRSTVLAQRLAGYVQLLTAAQAAGMPVTVPREWMAGTAGYRSGPSAAPGQGEPVVPVVPVSVFAADSALRDMAWRLGTEYRIDFLNEGMVCGLLARQKQLTGSLQRRAGWGTAALLVGGLAALVSITTGAVGADAGNGALAFFAVSVLVALLGVYLLVRVGWVFVSSGRPGGTRHQTTGYLHLLRTAHERGVAVPELPRWLDPDGAARQWR